MPRPLFNHSYQQLEALFNKDRDCIETLTLLRNELIHRNSSKAIKLFAAVKERLNAACRPISSPPPAPKVKATPSATTKLNPSGGQVSEDDIKEEDTALLAQDNERDAHLENLRIPDDLQIPSVFTKVRPPGTQWAT